MSGKMQWTFIGGEALAAEAALEPASEQFAVGGLLVDCGLIGGTPPFRAAAAVPLNVFGKWLQLARRERDLTVLQVAEKAQCDLAELVQLEESAAIPPQPRTVHKLAVFFDVNPKQLAILSGLIQDRPGSPLTHAAVRFAAMSEPSAKLSPIEQTALHEFARYLESREG